MKNWKNNSLIVVIVLALPNLLSIVNHYLSINSLAIKIILSILLFAITLVMNHFKVNRQVICLMFLLIIFYTVNVLLVEYKGIVTTEFLKMFVFGVLIMFISSYKLDFNLLTKTWYITACIFFIAMHLLFFDVIQREFSYMQLGFINNFVFAGVVLQGFKRKNAILIIIMFYLLVISILFGHRGSVLVNVMMLIYFLYHTLPYKKLYIFLTTMISMFLLYLFTFGKEIILRFLYGIQRLFPQVDSYTLKKVIRDFETGNLDSSGRDEIYSISLDMIENKNYLYPNGFGYFRHVTGIVFPHNIILDMYIVFGVLSIMFTLYLLFIVYNVKKKVSEDVFNIVSIIGIFSIVRLLSGGSFIEEFSFWVFVGLILGLNRKNGYNNHDYERVL